MAAFFPRVACCEWRLPTQADGSNSEHTDRPLLAGFCCHPLGELVRSVQLHEILSRERARL